MVLLVNLVNFAKQWFYTKTEDEELFKSYLIHIYYKTGVVGVDESDNSKYDIDTNYIRGELLVDGLHDVFYENGEITSDEDEGVTYATCKWTLP